MKEENVFSSKNLKRGIEISGQINQFGKPFAWGRDNVYKTKCPHCGKNLQFPSILPKMICYECGKVIDNLATSKDIKL